LLATGPIYHALVFFLLPVGLSYAAVSARRAPVDRVHHVALLARCAVALAMPRLLLIVAWEWHSPRTVPGYGGMPLVAIAEMLFRPIPDYKAPVTWGASGVWEYWAYVGIVSSLLALLSLRTPGRVRTLALACVATGLVLAWRSPWGNALAWIAPHLPFLSSARIYSRFLVLAVFGIALAAGSGATTLRTIPHGRLLALLLLFALATEYAVVVLPIWTRIFALPVSEVYGDWGIALPGARYHSIRSAPPFQSFSASHEMFNSRMLPLVMAGAVVRDAYVTMALPWARPPEGAVVKDWPDEGYRIANQELELFGDLRAGREIEIHLHYPKKYWKIADPTAARLEPYEAGVKLLILKPCTSVRIVWRSRLEIAGWIVSTIALLAAVVVVWRGPAARHAHVS